MDIPPSPPRRFSFSPQGSPPTRLVHKIRLGFRRGRLAVGVVVVVKLHCYYQINPAWVGHGQGWPYHPVAFQNTPPYPLLKQVPPTPSKTPSLVA